jgi:hypothetical protein
MTVFSATPVEKRFQSKSMLADIKFTKIRKGPFIGEMVIAEEVYQYRYPFYLPESLLFLPTYNDYYRNYMVKIFYSLKVILQVQSKSGCPLKIF